MSKKKKAKKSKSATVECRVPKETKRLIEGLAWHAGLKVEQLVSGVLQWAADNAHAGGVEYSRYLSCSEATGVVFFGPCGFKFNALERKALKGKLNRSQLQGREGFPIAILDFNEGAVSDVPTLVDGDGGGYRYAPKAA